MLPEPPNMKRKGGGQGSHQRRVDWKPGGNWHHTEDRRKRSGQRGARQPSEREKGEGTSTAGEGPRAPTNERKFQPSVCVRHCSELPVVGPYQWEGKIQKHFILLLTLHPGYNSSHLHVTPEETEAQSNEIICPRSPNL